MSCGCTGGCNSGCTTLKGDAGAAGSQILYGSGVPAPNLGVVGDTYINTANGDVYTKTATATWTLKLNITGATGAAGANGTTVLYDDWTPVSVTGGGIYTQLKTTGSAITLTTNGDSLVIKAGFTTTMVGFAVGLQLLVGSVNVWNLTGIPISGFGVDFVIIETEITRISDVLMRFSTKASSYSSSPNSLLNEQVYFTPANVAITSLSTGNIISTTVNNNGIGSTVACNYLRVLRNEI